jgi:hypothetical protein
MPSLDAPREACGVRRAASAAKIAAPEPKPRLEAGILARMMPDLSTMRAYSRRSSAASMGSAVVLMLLLVLLPAQAEAQGRGPSLPVGVGDSTLLAGLVQIEYAALWPGGDLAQRYGFHNGMGIRIDIKNRRNWTFGGSARFLFGTSIVEGDVLAALRGPSGFLIGTDGFQYVPIPNMRGLQFAFDVGKVTPLLAANPNSGISLSVGVGYLQHRILLDVERDFVPQVEGEYAKLYDRFSSGFWVRQRLGYLYSGEARFLNLHAGLELSQGFTQERRSFQGDLGPVTDTQRMDLQWGIFASWVLPIYENPKTRYFYN